MSYRHVLKYLPRVSLLPKISEFSGVSGKLDFGNSSKKRAKYRLKFLNNYQISVLSFS